MPITSILSMKVTKRYRHSKTLSFVLGAEEFAERSLIKKDNGIIFETKDNLTKDFIAIVKGVRSLLFDVTHFGKQRLSVII